MRLSHPEILRSSRRNSGYDYGCFPFFPLPLSVACPPKADKMREREGPAGISPWEGEGAAAVVMGL